MLKLSHMAWRMASVAGLCVGICGYAAPAKAQMTITDDRGGQIGYYVQTFDRLRMAGEKVVIDGNCLSACTLVLGLLPKSQLSFTPRARLGFHAAWMPDADGHPVTSPLGTQALWNIYPPQIRRWIGRHGGLSRKMIYLEGKGLAAMYSPHKPSRRPVHHARTPASKQQAAAH